MVKKQQPVPAAAGPSLSIFLTFCNLLFEWTADCCSRSYTIAFHLSGVNLFFYIFIEFLPPVF